MAAIITLAEAQSRLSELVRSLAPGEEVVITENQQPVARLVGEQARLSARPEPGLGKGSMVYMSPDFDEPLEEFQEFTE